MNARRTILVFVCGFAAVGITSNVRADFTFGEPVNLRTIIPDIDPAHEGPVCLSYDGLEMYIESDRPGGVGGFDLWVFKRASTDSNWGPAENLGPLVNTSKDDGGASISVDGLTLYYTSDIGRQWPDIYVTTRPTRDAPWGTPVGLGPKVNTAEGNGGPWISPDDLELYFWSYKSGGYGRCDIYVIRRETTDDPWGDPINLGPVVNTPTEDIGPCLSPDGLLLFFCDNLGWGDPPRPGGRGGSDIWMTRRASLSDPWQPPVNLGPPVNSSIREVFPRISPDGSLLYFLTVADPNTWENWQAPILPVVDFTGDEVVDLADLVLMIDNWGTDNTLYDIGPCAWGDGVVDIEDLKVFITHWEKANPAQSHDEP